MRAKTSWMFASTRPSFSSFTAGAILCTSSFVIRLVREARLSVVGRVGRISGRRCLRRSDDDGLRTCKEVGQRHFGASPANFSNPKRKRGNCRNVFPRLRFGLRCDAKVALSK